MDLQGTAHAEGQGFNGAFAAVGYRPDDDLRIGISFAYAGADGVAGFEGSKASLQRNDGNNNFQKIILLVVRACVSNTHGTSLL